MDKEALIEALSQRQMKSNYTEHLISLTANQDIGMLHELCYDQKNRSIAFRAAWILEFVAYVYPERFLAVMEDFLTRLPQQNNPSCQRHFTKILMLLTDPKALPIYQAAFAQANKENIVEVAFEWIIKTDTPVAVKANCMDILYNLYNMCREYDWIADDLRNQVEFLMRDGSPALQSRGKKMLAKLASPPAPSR